MKTQTITTSSGSYTITYPTTNVTLGGGSSPDAPQAFANQVYGFMPAFLEQSDGTYIFEQVDSVGRYLHKIKLYGRSAVGGEVVFYAEPFFEMQYDGTSAKFVSGYAKNILIQGNASHNVNILLENNGFKIQVYGPDTNSTDFIAILDIPELVSTTLLAIPTIYELQAGQFDLSPGQVYPIDLVYQNGGLSGGVLDVEELPDGTYDMVANVKSQQYPQNFEVNVTKRFIVANNFASVTVDPNYTNFETVVNTTNGATAALQYGTHPVTGAVGVYVTATGYSTPSKFEGTLTVTPVLS